MIQVTELEFKNPGGDYKDSYWGPIDGYSWINTEAISRVRVNPEGTEVTWHCGGSCVVTICKEPPEHFLFPHPRST